MGKAARNEVRKLEAAFINNLSAGAILAGLFGTFFTLLSTGRVHVAHIFGGLLVAGLGVWLHFQARSCLAEIED